MIEKVILSETIDEFEGLVSHLSLKERTYYTSIFYQNSELC